MVGKDFDYRWGVGWGRTAQSFLASHPGGPGLILGIPKKFSLDVAEIY